jgi:hypothetical protein
MVIELYLDRHERPAAARKPEPDGITIGTKTGRYRSITRRNGGEPPGKEPNEDK